MAYWTNDQWHAVTYSYSGAYSSTNGGTYSGGSWSYTDIDTLLCNATGAGSGGCSKALAVNNANMLTGFVTQVANEGITVSSLPQAFVLSGGTVSLSAIPSGLDSSRGQAINAKGDVAGYASSSTGGGPTSPMLAINNGAPATRSSTWACRPVTAMPTAYGLNDYDMVVGDAAGGTGGRLSLDHRRGSLLRPVRRGERPRRTDRQSIPSGWTLGTVRSINDAGQITGVEPTPPAASRPARRASSPCPRRFPATPTSTARWTSTT